MTEYERREYIVLYECDGDSMFDMGTKERIVRCRDCANADYAEVHMFDGTRTMKWTCTRFESFHHMVLPDGFCAWGVRKGGD